MAKAGKPPPTFDELMSTPIDFLAYVLHNLKIENLTQEHLVRPAFNLFKGTCKSRVELEYHFQDKPLPLIEDQGRQVVPANYFFNKDLEYLKGGSLSNKYTTSTTKTKAAKYDTIKGIEDMVPSLWSPVKSLHKFVEGDFSRLNLHDIKDMLLLLVLKKLSNLERHHQEKKHVFPKKHDIKDMFLHRLMRFDELYKFCDGTLSSVRRVLPDIASSLKIEYLPKRR
ncbi:hypothetical protein Tco_1370513 [Tanacetum coccineum]